MLPLLAPHIQYWSTPKRAAHFATEVLMNKSGQTGIYYDDGGKPKLGSVQVQEPEFADPVVCRNARFVGHANISDPVAATV